MKCIIFFLKTRNMNLENIQGKMFRFDGQNGNLSNCAICTKGAITLEVILVNLGDLF